MAQVMFTKDGSRVGNGIMFKSDELGPLGSSRYHVETDFGNFMILNYNELFDYYTCGPQTSYEQWRADRLDLRLCSSMEEHLPVEQRDAGSVPVTTAISLDR